MHLKASVISSRPIVGPGEEYGFRYMAATPLGGKQFMLRRTHGFDTGDIVVAPYIETSGQFRLTNINVLVSSESHPFDHLNRKVEGYEDQTYLGPNALYAGSPAGIGCSQTTTCEKGGLRCNLVLGVLTPDRLRVSEIKTLATPEELPSRFAFAHGGVYLKEPEPCGDILGEPYLLAECDEGGTSSLALLKPGKDGITAAHLFYSAHQDGSQHVSTAAPFISLDKGEHIFLLPFNRRRNFVWSITYMIVRIINGQIEILYVAPHNIVEAPDPAIGGFGPDGQVIAFASAVIPHELGYTVFWHHNDLRCYVTHLTLQPTSRQF